MRQEDKLKKEINLIYKKGKKIPFANYAFPFFIFMEKLYNTLISNNVQDVLFMAREGHFLIQLFEEYQRGKKVKIKTHYVYVSRKSTTMAALNGRNEKEFFPIFNSCRDLDLISFLKNLSFSSDEMESLGITEKDKTTIYNFPESKVFINLLENKHFLDILEDKCSESKKLLQQYINGVVDYSTNKELYIVDVGWKGTIQDNLYYALTPYYNLHGLYFGVEKYTGNENSHNSKEGLIFDVNRRETLKWDFETHLIEQILAAPHGSTACYKMDGCNVTAVLEEYSAEDCKLFELSSIVQSAILLSYKKIVSSFDKYNADINKDIENMMVRYYLKALLLLDKKTIEYESKMLTPGTNNFGWFDKIPTRESKISQLKSLMRDLRALAKNKSGVIAYSNYFAVKMNARHKYSWKIIGYRIIYLTQIISLRR